MASMLCEIRGLFREERVYAYLFIGILLVYALIFGMSSRAEEPSEVTQKIKQAEAMAEKQGGEKEIIAKILRENPQAGLLLLAFLAVSGGAIGTGIILDAVFLSRVWRKQPVIAAVRTAEPAAWGMRDLARVIILFFSFSIALNFLLGILKGVFAGTLSENILILVHTSVTDFFVVALILHVVLRKYGQKWQELGLGLKTWARDIAVGFLGYLGTLPVFMFTLILLLALISIFAYEPAPHPLVEVFIQEDRKNPLLIGYSIFLACVLGPAIEELFFRGFCYPVLKKEWGPAGGAFATATLFALIHQSAFAFAPILILGLVLAYLYEKRGSLVPSITMHVIHNSFFIGYFFLMKRIYLDKFLS